MATVFKHRLVTLTLMLCSVAPAYAGVNDFFGSSIPTVGSDSPSINGTSGSGAAQSMPSELAPQSPSTSSHSDYTDDEKRMRKKYKTSIKHAETLIAKGDKLIKDGESKKDDKMLKKGKILKGIGERTLDNLKSNNPLPEARSGINAPRAEESTAQ
ncbi:MAG: hypothetical protein IPP57_04815 [Candidatus Obscuribacter sp.]|nr:hypothetical protein [Candidatus Obscuribacter sp.]MDQ5968236.1 hypothetical protein [Cyanobacteriota bacterium erpe_2018_sw_39hr_WHONDRS-SW48-000098_B_bin.30]MBK7836235.1 hypothetical protein [Candidatus Obscuribacter sp.]MBK9617912.1 hypothetical protein [Candidatus Obscuribacter sp.]MBK9770137.1 hypothetical protein [Candidatus Obscuribacter sp.]